MFPLPFLRYVMGCGDWSAWQVSCECIWPLRQQPGPAPQQRGSSIRYKAEGFPKTLKAAVPDGIDIYYENVGGAVFDAVMPLLNTSSRIPVCGLISQYNATSLPEGPDRMNLLLGTILRKRMTVRGFIVFDDFGHLYPEFAKQMGDWVSQGKIIYREEVITGLEQAPAAFVGLLRGEAFGKRVIKLND